MRQASEAARIAAGPYGEDTDSEAFAPTDLSDDHYKILRVSPSADAEAVHAAYLHMARRVHPDVNPGNGAVERMMALNEAYEVLSDPVRRAAYDRERLGRILRTAKWSTPAPHSRPPMTWDGAPFRVHKRLRRLARAIGIVIVLIGVAALLFGGRAVAPPDAALDESELDAPTADDSGIVDEAE